MSSAFSKSGYFAQISDGKLKVWNTKSNSLEQEYTPEFHLTAPCTCLEFIENIIPGPNSKSKKKIQKISNEPDIILGTSSGLFLVYSLVKSQLLITINSDTNQHVSCLSLLNQRLFAGVESTVVISDIYKRSITDKWKIGNDKITAILALNDKKHLVTASKTIKLWNLSNKELVKNFVGHSSEVSVLKQINDCHIISGSQDDRLLNCWNFSSSALERNATVSFQMQDGIVSLQIDSESENISIGACTQSGSMHVFQHILQGAYKRPIKPKKAIHVVSENSDQDKTIMPIPIIACNFVDKETLCIAYGSNVLVAFENVALKNLEEVTYLNRSLLKPDTSTAKTVKIKTPLQNDVHYLTTHITAVPSSAKRKIDGTSTKEITLGQRLENLKLTDSKVPRSDNVAQLLLQGLQSKDKEILRTVLSNRNETIIRNTVQRLPAMVLPSLIEEINTYFQGKTHSRQAGILWLKHLLLTHMSFFAATPSLMDQLKLVQRVIQLGKSLQPKIQRLRLDLDLSNKDFSSEEQEQTTVVYNDRDDEESEASDDGVSDDEEMSVEEESDDVDSDES